MSVLVLAFSLALSPAAPASAGPGQGLDAALAAEILLSEYAFSPGEDGAWTAPNRAHGLRARVDERGLVLTSRVKGSEREQGGWRLAMRLTAVGREGALGSTGAASISRADGARAEVHRPGIVEWYVNDERGLEQGFTLFEPPEGSGAARPLLLELGLETDLSGFLAPGGEAIVFKRDARRPVLRYAGLVVEDAAGRRLTARLATSAGVLRILVDDRDAVYPIAVDPLMTTAEWSGESDQGGAHFGFSVATAGDVDGDGYSDLLVGAENYDNGAIADVGRAYLFRGSASGLLTAAAWTSFGPGEGGARFGHSVAPAGDVNDDGFADVIVGAPYYGKATPDEGAAYVYLGSSSGLATTFAWHAEGDQSGAGLGKSVATGGDLNGDGAADVIVGAWSYDSGEADEGAAFVWYGHKSGLGPDGTPSNADWMAQSNQTFAAFGVSVATAGDIDADGYADVVVGAYLYDDGQTDEGAAFLWEGGALGLPAGKGNPAQAAWSGYGDQDLAEYGLSVGTAGDLDGDGYSEVVVGAPLYDDGETNEGKVFAYFGGSPGLGATALWTAQLDQADALFGRSAAAAGDVNGDGYADLVAGAYLYDWIASDGGAVFAWFGSSGFAVLPDGTASSADWFVWSDQPSAELGWSVGTAGDVDGDGFNEVVAGARKHDNGSADEGGAFLYLGSGETPREYSHRALSAGQAGARFGQSVASAGDVNGDGYADVVVGIPDFDGDRVDEGKAVLYYGGWFGPGLANAWEVEGNQTGARFGISVAGAGDMNGDGYDDVIVGADLMERSTGPTDEGRAFVYFGSAAGLATGATLRPSGGQLEAHFGAWVAGAGDVNGDGYADAIVGAPLYDDGQGNEGAAFVFLGSAAPDVVADWTATSDQIGAQMGASVAGAGDANGDGFSDVLVGAPFHDGGETDEGRAWLYLGSATGLAAAAAWTEESDQAGARYGAVVAGIGDMNGDGLSDAAVGSPHYDGTGTDDGRLYVYTGSVAGVLTAESVWTGVGDGAQIGSAAAAAGDVNGDGYSDHLVGRPFFVAGAGEVGQAFLGYGSSTGAESSDWGPLGTEDGEEFGAAVAGADANGDGFSDLVVGAPYHDDAEVDEGMVLVYYGSGGQGALRRPRQLRTDGATPIGVLGKSDDDYSFRIEGVARSAAGRDQVRLEWEVEPLGTLFDGIGLSRSDVLDTGAPTTGGSAVLAGELISGLQSARRYHWRARATSRSPYFPRSPWVGQPHNAPQEMDLLTNGFPDADEDGFQNDVDCDDSDDHVWSLPGEATGVVFTDDLTLEWTAADPGGTAAFLRYDVVKTTNADDFLAGTSDCLESDDGPNTKAIDLTNPPPGRRFYYLVRPENACGTGPLGAASGGTPRAARSCP